MTDTSRGLEGKTGTAQGRRRSAVQMRGMIEAAHGPSRVARRGRRHRRGDHARDDEKDDGAGLTGAAVAGTVFGLERRPAIVAGAPGRQHEAGWRRRGGHLVVERTRVYDRDVEDHPDHDEEEGGTGNGSSEDH
jgi:hypothetical protein